MWHPVPTRRVVVLFFVVLTLLTAAAARAQTNDVPNSSPRYLTDQAEVSVLTMLPGDAVHAHWGHTAIRIHDPGLDPELDVVFNFGTFDFYGPGFVLDFVFANSTTTSASNPWMRSSLNTNGKADRWSSRSST